MLMKNLPHPGDFIRTETTFAVFSVSATRIRSNSHLTVFGCREIQPQC
jgi:hypothetical protein